MAATKALAEAKPRSRAEYVSRGNALCTEYRNKVGKLERTQTLDDLVRVDDTAIEVFTPILAKLHALTRSRTCARSPTSGSSPATRLSRT